MYRIYALSRDGCEANLAWLYGESVNKIVNGLALNQDLMLIQVYNVDEQTLQTMVRENKHKWAIPHPNRNSDPAYADWVQVTSTPGDKPSHRRLWTPFGLLSVASVGVA